MDSDCEDIIVEEPAAILARRKNEDDLSAKMQSLLADHDKYLEERNKPNSTAVDSDVDDVIKNICGSTEEEMRASFSSSITEFSKGETVFLKDHCFRVFSAENLSPSSFLGSLACGECQWFQALATWREAVGHLETFAQRGVMHTCGVTRRYYKYLFFLMSVCEEGAVTNRCYHALWEHWVEPDLSVTDILTVLFNWGFKKNLMRYDFEISPEVRNLKVETKFEGASNAVDTSTAERNPEELPVSPSAVSNTLNFIWKMVHKLDLELDEGVVFAVLRTCLAASIDSSVAYAAHRLRPIIWEMLEHLEAEKWPEEKVRRLVAALHLRELDVLDQLACARLLTQSTCANATWLQGCVAYAILQELHGVPQNEVVYVAEVRATHLKELLPGPVQYSGMDANRLHTSLRALADCVSAVAPADTEDSAFYTLLVHHLSWLQHQGLPRMNMLDTHIIKNLICQLDIIWKAKRNISLEKRGDCSPLMSYM